MHVTGDHGTVAVDFRSGENPLESGDPGPHGLQVGMCNAMLPIANPAPLLRRAFDLPKMPIRSARVYATAGGQYEVTLNGLPLTVDGAAAAFDRVPDSPQALKGLADLAAGLR